MKGMVAHKESKTNAMLSRRAFTGMFSAALLSGAFGFPSSVFAARDELPFRGSGKFRMYLFLENGSGTLEAELKADESANAIQLASIMFLFYDAFDQLLGTYSMDLNSEYRPVPFGGLEAVCSIQGYIYRCKYSDGEVWGDPSWADNLDELFEKGVPIDVLVKMVGENEWGEDTTEYVDGHCTRSLEPRLGYGSIPSWDDVGDFAYDNKIILFHNNGVISSVVLCPTDILFIYFDAYGSLMGSYAYHATPSGAMHEVRVRGAEDAASVEAYIVGYRQGDEIWGVPADATDLATAVVLGEHLVWISLGTGHYQTSLSYEDGEPKVF